MLESFRRKPEATKESPVPVAVPPPPGQAGESAPSGGRPSVTQFRPEPARKPAEHAAIRAGSLRPGAEAGEGSKLIVGRDIRLKGEITACDTLIVEGRIEASMDARVIQVSESGIFKGDASVDQAEIRGRFEGTLTVRDYLLVCATGRIAGSVRYGQIEIERGGEIGGDVTMLTADERARRAGPSKAEAAAGPKADAVTSGAPRSATTVAATGS